jgi:hypothetical protein
MTTEKNQMSDLDLIGYAELHCLTELALFSAEQVNRMIALAGNPAGYRPATSWVSGHDEMAELCKLARARLKPPAPAPVALHLPVRMTLITTGGAPEVAYPSRRQADAFASCSGPEVKLKLVDGFFTATPRDQSAADALSGRPSTKCGFCRVFPGTLHHDECVFVGLMPEVTPSAQQGKASESEPSTSPSGPSLTTAEKDVVAQAVAALAAAGQTSLAAQLAQLAGSRA